MEKQGGFNGQVMSQMDGGGICSQVELQGDSFGHWWEHWSYIPENPAAVRTSGGITAWDSSEVGLRRSKDVAALKFMQKSAGKHGRKHGRNSRNSTMPTISRAKLSQAFHAGEAMVWRAGSDNKGA